jgi:hypothetical protein
VPSLFASTSLADITGLTYSIYTIALLEQKGTRVDSSSNIHTYLQQEINHRSLFDCCFSRSTCILDPWFYLYISISYEVVHTLAVGIIVGNKIKWWVEISVYYLLLLYIKFEYRLGAKNDVSGVLCAIIKYRGTDKSFI